MKLTSFLGLVGVLASSSALALAADKPANISEHIDQALRSNADYTRFEDWKNSGLTPEDIFERVESTGTPAAWNELCGKLASLDSESLALFAHEIEHLARPERLRCRKRLLTRLEAYWAKSRQELEIAHHNRILDGSAEAPLPQLASEIRYIDAKAGEVLHDGHLKRGDKSGGGEIALTFDDGPHPTRTERILKTLKEAGVRATFFEVGEMAAHFHDLPAKVIAAGHTVGSHSWNHPQLPRLFLAKKSEDCLDPKLEPRLARSRSDCNIIWGHETVMEMAGVDTPFFRFPYGAVNRPLQNFVKERGVASFFWNMDSLDWKLRNPAALLQNVIGELNREKGGIILFHDIQEQTAIVLPHVIEELAKRGMTTVVFVPKPDSGAPAPKP